MGMLNPTPSCALRKSTYKADWLHCETKCIEKGRRKRKKRGRNRTGERQRGCPWARDHPNTYIRLDPSPIQRVTRPRKTTHHRHDRKDKNHAQDGRKVLELRRRQRQAQTPYVQLACQIDDGNQDDAEEVLPRLVPSTFPNVGVGHLV